VTVMPAVVAWKSGVIGSVSGFCCLARPVRRKYD